MLVKGSKISCARLAEFILLKNPLKQMDFSPSKAHKGEIHPPILRICTGVYT